MRILLFASLLIFFLSSCANVEPAEDQWDLEEKEGKVNLFGTKEEEGLLGNWFSASESSTVSTSNNVNMPAIDQQSFEDFENFKAWRRAQDPESPNYQEYQDWRAYQQYLRFKAEKEQAQPAPAQ